MSKFSEFYKMFFQRIKNKKLEESILWKFDKKQSNSQFNNKKYLNFLLVQFKKLVKKLLAI